MGWAKHASFYFLTKTKRKKEAPSNQLQLLWWKKLALFKNLLTRTWIKCFLTFMSKAHSPDFKMLPMPSNLKTVTHLFYSLLLHKSMSSWIKKEGIPKNDCSELLGTNQESLKNDISIVFSFLPRYLKWWPRFNCVCPIIRNIYV